jgi:DNA primase
MKFNIDVLDILDYYNVKHKSANTDGWVRFQCPFHNDKSPSASISVKNGGWKCFSGCGSGNLLDFVAKIENISLKQAYDFLQQKYGDLVKFYEISDLEVRIKEILNEDIIKKKEFKKNVLDNMSSVPHEYYLNRGYTKEDWEYWELKFSKKRNAIIFPYKNIKNELIGVFGRRIDNKIKARFISSKGLNKQENLYGLNKVSKQKKIDIIIIVESQWSVHRAFQLGFKNVVATLGSDISEKQIDLISSYCDKIILAFDNDINKERNVGLSANTKAISKFRNNCFQIKLFDYNNSNKKDISEMNKKQIEFGIKNAKDSIAFLLQNI